MLVHSKAINKLAPSDYAMIKKEHKQLEKYLARVSRILCKRRLITAEAFFPQTE